MRSIISLNISHLTLRKLLGCLGVALPIILPLGACMFGGISALQPSISAYYYTNMGDVFVGVLWGFGLFLFTYKGYKPKIGKYSDNAFTNIAGIMAILVSIFPTNNDGCGKLCNPEWIGTVHLVSAASFFIILGYISIFKFTLSDKPKKLQSDSKKRRNILYIFSGIFIWVSMFVLFIYIICFKDIWPANTVFWFETIALEAFGISWLVKGRALSKVGF